MADVKFPFGKVGIDGRGEVLDVDEMKTSRLYPGS